MRFKNVQFIPEKNTKTVVFCNRFVTTVWYTDSSIGVKNLFDTCPASWYKIVTYIIMTILRWYETEKWVRKCQ